MVKEKPLNLFIANIQTKQQFGQFYSRYIGFYQAVKGWQERVVEVRAERLLQYRSRSWVPGGQH